MFMGFIESPGGGPHRNPANQWYVSEEEWPSETYPPWAHGAGYVISQVSRLTSRFQCQYFLPSSQRLAVLQLESSNSPFRSLHLISGGLSSCLSTNIFEARAGQLARAGVPRFTESRVTP